MAEGALTRRERVRATTMEEITATARRLLVEQGSEAASLRAIAREMGMTAPGLYRYYDSREELIRHVCAGIFRELTADIRRAIEEANPPVAEGAVHEGALPEGALPGDDEMRVRLARKMSAHTCRMSSSRLS